MPSDDDPENGEVLADADVVIDCLDTLPARFLLESAARRRNIPMVTAAVAGTTAQGRATSAALEGIARQPSAAIIEGAEVEVSFKGEQVLGRVVKRVGMRA